MSLFPRVEARARATTASESNSSLLGLVLRLVPLEEKMQRSWRTNPNPNLQNLNSTVKRIDDLDSAL